MTRRRAGRKALILQARLDLGFGADEQSSGNSQRAEEDEFVKKVEQDDEYTKIVCNLLTPGLEKDTLRISLEALCRLCWTHLQPYFTHMERLLAEMRAKVRDMQKQLQQCNASAMREISNLRARGSVTAGGRSAPGVAIQDDESLSFHEALQYVDKKTMDLINAIVDEKVRQAEAQMNRGMAAEFVGQSLSAVNAEACGTEFWSEHRSLGGMDLESQSSDSEDDEDTENGMAALLARAEQAERRAARAEARLAAAEARLGAAEARLGDAQRQLAGAADTQQACRCEELSAEVEALKEERQRRALEQEANQRPAPVPRCEVHTQTDASEAAAPKALAPAARNSAPAAKEITADKAQAARNSAPAAKETNTSTDTSAKTVQPLLVKSIAEAAAPKDKEPAARDSVTAARDSATAARDSATAARHSAPAAKEVAAAPSRAGAAAPARETAVGRRAADTRSAEVQTDLTCKDMKAMNAERKRLEAAAAELKMQIRGLLEEGKKKGIDLSDMMETVGLRPLLSAKQVFVRLYDDAMLRLRRAAKQSELNAEEAAKAEASTAAAAAAAEAAWAARGVQWISFNPEAEQAPEAPAQEAERVPLVRPPARAPSPVAPLPAHFGGHAFMRREPRKISLALLPPLAQHGIAHGFSSEAREGPARRVLVNHDQAGRQDAHEQSAQGREAGAVADFLRLRRMDREPGDRKEAQRSLAASFSLPALARAA